MISSHCQCCFAHSFLFASHCQCCFAHSFLFASQRYHHHQAFDSSTRFLVCVTVMIHNPADGSCAERASGAASGGGRAHGPCRDLPPLLSTVSAEVQGGVGGKARAARRPTLTEDGKDQGGHALHVEHDGGQGAGALQPRRTARRGPASTSV